MKPLSLEGCVHYFSIILINYPKGAKSEKKDFLWLMVRGGKDDHGKPCIGIEHPHLCRREHEEAVVWWRQSGSRGKASQKHSPTLRSLRSASS